MEALVKEQIEQIINALETETLNIASSIDLTTNASNNFQKTQDLINIGSVILWLKNTLRQDINPEELEDRIKTFEEVIRDPRYLMAGTISQISYLTNRLNNELLDRETLEKIINELIKLDENKFYVKVSYETISKYDQEKLTSWARVISNTSSKDAAKIIRNLLQDEEFIKKVKESGYRIDEDFANSEHHHKQSLLEQINNSQDISNRLNKIIKQIKRKIKR